VPSGSFLRASRKKAGFDAKKVHFFLFLWHNTKFGASCSIVVILYTVAQCKKQFKNIKGKSRQKDHR
jgi:hypothetical protein